MPYELENAIGPRTAGVVYLVSPFTSPPGILSFEDVCRIAHARGVPVLVDVASMIPPRENLFRYLRGGADLVIVSGGKGIRGPQSTGILAGRRDLIRAAMLNASPNQAIGRAAKTSKEEIVGLVTALELFLAEDEKAEMERFREVCASIVAALGEVPGIRAVVEQDPVNRVLPHAVLYFEPSWTGPSGRAVQLALAAGEPHIYVQQGPHQGGVLRRDRDRSHQSRARGRGHHRRAIARGAHAGVRHQGIDWCPIGAKLRCTPANTDAEDSRPKFELLGT
jgi:L-seryl-tRNA(Ser) seleniumtransferase